MGGGLSIDSAYIILKKYKTFSVLIYSYINTSGNWKNEKLCGNTTPAGRSVFTQFRVFPIFTSVDMYRLSYERRGDISFIARETISYFVTSERSERGTKYDIVMRAIKLILPSLECDNLFITYLCLYLEQKSDYIFK